MEELKIWSDKIRHKAIFGVALCGIIVLAGLNHAHAQKRLQRGVNTFQDVEMNPVLSGDGKTMIFMRKYEMGPTWNLMVTKKYKGNWTQPQTVDFYNKYAKLYNKHGYFLSYDGNTLYFTSRKGPGVGRYDVVFSEFVNGQWTNPENYGKPINSVGDEGCPSVSADGKTMYFVRGKVDPTTETIVGKIFTATRKGKTSWNTPMEIKGSNINTGQESTPIILTDNQTLIFASRRSGGKGGFDLYYSRLEDGAWSAPKAFDVFNSSDDELRVSIPAMGSIGYFHKMHEEQSLDLFKAKIPEEMQQKKVTMVQGNISSKAGSALEGIVYVFDAESNKQISKMTTDKKGDYWLFLAEGKAYDVAVYDKAKSMTFESMLYDGREQEEFEKTRAKAKLEPWKAGTEFKLNNVQFAFNSDELDEFSSNELGRLARMLKKDNQSFTLTVALKDYQESEEQSRALSETRVDTIGTEPDSDGEWNTKTVYHNDRTERQSEAIKKVLVDKGIPESNIQMKLVAEADPKYARMNRVEVWIKLN